MFYLSYYLFTQVNTAHTFVPILNTDISSSQINTNLIQTIQVNSRNDCVNSCKKLTNCVLIWFKTNQCNLYNALNEAYFQSVSNLNQDVYLFKRLIDDSTSINSHLQYYWPFNNGLTDIVSNFNILKVVNGNFTTDRLNRNLSAMKLSYGYLQLPAGNYISGDFTISTWIKVTEYYAVMRLLEFSDPNLYYLIRILITDETTNSSFFRIVGLGGANPARVYSSIPLKLDKWQHFVVTSNSSFASIYINGELVGSGISVPAYSITYTNSFIGKYCGDSPIYASFEIDDFKIFNISLNQQQVIKVLNSIY